MVNWKKIHKIEEEVICPVCGKNSIRIYDEANYYFVCENCETTFLIEDPEEIIEL